MKILTDSRIYKSQELETHIHLADGVQVLIFDETNMLEQVTF